MEIECVSVVSVALGWRGIFVRVVVVDHGRLMVSPLWSENINGDSGVSAGLVFSQKVKLVCDSWCPFSA